MDIAVPAAGPGCSAGHGGLRRSRRARPVSSTRWRPGGRGGSLRTRG